MEQHIYEQFLAPPNAFRGKPLWSWNGELEEEQLMKQIHTFKQMGFGGFYMHARVGLKTEYMGEEWMRLTRLCAEEAQRLGMEAWLYDEDRWPSGTAGGIVTQDARFRLKFLRVDTFEPETYEWTEGTTAAFHCQLDGIQVSDYVQLQQDQSSAWPRTEGTILVFRETEMEPSTFYNGSTYIDTLNREATAHFLKLTHDKYEQSCGDLFGDSIQGIFTDEPHRGSLMDGFGITNKDKQNLVPWTYDLFERFSSTFGYDLIPRLPELFYRLDGNVVSQVKWHFVELLQQMFIDNFAVPVQEWCSKHGLRLTGHVLHEDSLSAQTAMSGSVMRYYEHMDDPGIDVLTEGNRNYWVAKQLSSVARQLGKQWQFSELYGCTGWQMSFQDHKAVGDWQALFGINVRSHHLAWYTMEGESKRDFPGSISLQSAWWQEYGKVETYYARLGFILAQGKAVCDVLVLNPVESVWSQVYTGWSSFLAAQSTEVQEIEQCYKELFHFLTDAQVDFDYGDEHLLAQYGSILHHESDNPQLQIGQSAYRVVIIAGMLTIRSTTIEVLHSFIQGGGTVVFAGAPPTYVDALPSQAATQRLERSTYVAWNQREIVEACLPHLTVRVHVSDTVTGQPISNVFCQIRLTEDGYVAVFHHVDRDEWLRNVSLHLSIHGYVEEWHAVSGSRFRLSTVESEEGLTIHTEFPPSGERIYVIREQRDEAVPQQLLYEEKIAGEFQGPFDYKLSEPNVCVLDRASYRIDDGEWQDEVDILQADRSIRSAFEVSWRNNKMIQPWYAIAHDRWPKQALGRISLQFSFDIEDVPQTAMEVTWLLAMEHPEKYAITMNGVTLSNKPVEGHWVDHCFQLLSIPPTLLQVGRNRIVLETGFHERTDLEPIYLLGDFGVRLVGTHQFLTALPEQLEVGDLSTQMLPFYGGMIAFHVAAHHHLEDRSLSDSADAHLIRLPNMYGACAKVVFENGPEQSMLWTPYEADITLPMRTQDSFVLQLFLTRRNTFGPLHMVPVQSSAYSPDHFHTQGDHYAEDYRLVPAGLMAPPQHIVRQYNAWEQQSGRS